MGGGGGAWRADAGTLRNNDLDLHRITGIGLEVTKKLITEGFHVVANARNEERLVAAFGKNEHVT